MTHPQSIAASVFRSAKFLALACSIVLLTQAIAQSGGPVISSNSEKSDRTGTEVITLTPFVVNSDRDQGYVATSTLAGTRLATSLADLGSAISVYTPEFLKDVGATDNMSLLIYATGTEVGGVRGNFTGAGNGAALDETPLFTNPNNNTRVRGLAAADNTRNYFRSVIPLDSYNTSRVDIVRGSNSILFGLGSPAGIINTTTNPAVFKDINEISIRFGQYGSYRATADFNKVLIKKQLAVRLAILNDQKEYRQEPAFSHAKRYYLAGTWEPARLNSESMTTSVKMNYEDGKVDSNNPRTMTPQDQITPWFKSGLGTDGGLNKLTVNPYITGWGATGQATLWKSPNDIPTGDPTLYPQGLKGFTSSGQNFWGMSTEANANRNPWLDHLGTIFDGQLFLENAYSTTPFMQSGYRQTSIGNIQGVPFYRVQGVSPYSKYAQLAKLPNADLGVYKNRGLSDRRIFDYVNHLLEGSNKSEFNDFHGAEFSLAQTFLKNAFGYELGYTQQRGASGQTSFLAGSSAGIITVDINSVLPDGSPNPNVGRAVVTNNFTYGNNVYTQDIDTFRATAFAKVNLSDRFKRSVLGKILGNHTFTAFYSDDQGKTEQRNFARYALPVSYGVNNLRTSDRTIEGLARQLDVIYYLSGDLTNSEWPTGLSSVQGNALPPASGNIRYFDPTWTATGVSATAPWIDPVYPQGAVLTQFSNPANYAGWSTTNVKVMDSSTSDISSMYTGASLIKTKIKSSALVWQGQIWDGLLIPMVGVRRDKARSFAVNAIQGPEHTVDLTSSDYRLPDKATGTTEGTTRTYSVVAHLARLIPRGLPMDLGLSLFYNQSASFQPAAQRVDVLGHQIASPTGKTKDYGFLLTSANSKYSLRLNWYETNVQNASYEGGFASAFAIGWGTMMPWNYAMKAQNKVEAYARTEALPEGGYSRNPTTVWWDGSTLTEADILPAFFKFWDSLPQDFKTAWNMKHQNNEWAIPGYAGGLGYTMPVGLTATSDTHAKGLEAEFVANPLPNWRISFSASKTSASRSNVGGELGSFVEMMAKAYDGPAGAVRLFGNSNQLTGTVRGWFRNYVWGDYQLAKLQEGSDAPELRKWHANLVTNYKFTQKILRGVNVGGAARYMSGSITGYPVLKNGSPAPGQPDRIWDIEHPYRSPVETRIDLWIGYSRKLKNHLNWQFQLNVTDAFASDSLIPISAQPDGSYGALRIPPTTSWFMTNTFSF